MRLDLVKKHLQRYSVDNNGCWNWTGPLRNGYGHMRAGAATIGAHRFFFENHVRRLNAGEWVLHRCDNKQCVNPDHLYAGSQRDNVRDAVERGLYIGNMSAAKLTADDVAAIRLSNASTVSIAREYGMSNSAIRAVRKGETYLNVVSPKRQFVAREWAKGERHHSARLSVDQVVAIKKALSEGQRPTDLGAIYGVCESSIRRIRQGCSWAHV